MVHKRTRAGLFFQSFAAAFLLLQDEAEVPQLPLSAAQSPDAQPLTFDRYKTRPAPEYESHKQCQGQGPELVFYPFIVQNVMSNICKAHSCLSATVVGPRTCGDAMHCGGFPYVLIVSINIVPEIVLLILGRLNRGSLSIVRE